MWCRLAAEDGHIAAQVALAECYEKGLGVRQDYAEALKWYEKAASCGSCHAMHMLAIRYSLGIGCEKNYGRAYYLTVTAVDKGYDEALWQMSHCFRNGYGVKQDIEKADRYLFQALDKNTATVWVACKPETAAKEFDSRMRWAGNDLVRGRSGDRPHRALTTQPPLQDDQDRLAWGFYLRRRQTASASR